MVSPSLLECDHVFFWALCSSAHAATIDVKISASQHMKLVATRTTDSPPIPAAQPLLALVEADNGCTAIRKPKR